MYLWFLVMRSIYRMKREGRVDKSAVATEQSLSKLEIAAFAVLGVVLLYSRRHRDDG
jgi:hypothetical protein